MLAVLKRMIPGTLQRRIGHTGDRKGGFFSPLDARKRIALARTSSAKAGLISWKPAAARHGDSRKPAAIEQATSAILPHSSTVAATQSGYARIRA